MRTDRLQQTLLDLNGTSADIEASALISTDGLMMASALPQGMDEDRIQVFSDYPQVLDRMGGALEKHDVVLVKGSRFVELDRFVEGVC